MDKTSSSSDQYNKNKKGIFAQSAQVHLDLPIMAYYISYYNKSGNFLGPAIFETKKQVQDYLEEYERKLLSHVASVNNNSNTTNQKQQYHQKKKNKKSTKDNNSIRRGRGKGRPSRNENIKLKVFQESTLPPVNKPSSFFRGSK
jgi:hypothetical protein